MPVNTLGDRVSPRGTRKRCRPLSMCRLGPRYGSGMPSVQRNPTRCHPTITDLRSLDRRPSVRKIVIICYSRRVIAASSSDTTEYKPGYKIPQDSHAYPFSTFYSTVSPTTSRTPPNLFSRFDEQIIGWHLVHNVPFGWTPSGERHGFFRFYRPVTQFPCNTLLDHHCVRRITIGRARHGAATSWPALLQDQKRDHAC